MVELKDYNVEIRDVVYLTELTVDKFKINDLLRLRSKDNLVEVFITEIGYNERDNSIRINDETGNYYIIINENEIVASEGFVFDSIIRRLNNGQYRKIYSYDINRPNRIMMYILLKSAIMKETIQFDVGRKTDEN